MLHCGRVSSLSASDDSRASMHASERPAHDQAASSSELLDMAQLLAETKARLQSDANSSTDAGAAAFSGCVGGQREAEKAGTQASGDAIYLLY